MIESKFYSCYELRLKHINLIICWIFTILTVRKYFVFFSQNHNFNWDSLNNEFMFFRSIKEVDINQVAHSQCQACQFDLA